MRPNSPHPSLPKSTELGCTADLSPCCFSNPSKSCPKCPEDAKAASPLFGCTGERFEPGGSRLPYDWSYAGYTWGEKPIPSDVKVVADVKKTYGAVGGGFAP